MSKLKTDSPSENGAQSIGQFAAACGVTEMQFVPAAAFIHQQKPSIPAGKLNFENRNLEILKPVIS